MAAGRRHGAYTSAPGSNAGQPGETPTYDMGQLDDPTARSDAVKGWDSTLDFVESDGFNYAVTAGFVGYAGVSGAMATGTLAGGATAMGTALVPVAAGLAGAMAGAWAGEKLGNWAMESMGYQKIAQNGEMPAHILHPIAHESGWGLGAMILGAVAGLAAAVFVVATFGTGLVVLAAAAAVGGALAGLGAGFASAAGQYGTNKGVISKGSPNVTFEGKPVARITDEVICEDHGVQKIAQGNMTVFANGLAIAHIGHKTTCDGTINDGCKTIVIDLDTNPQQLDIDVGWMKRITRTGLAILNFLPFPRGKQKPGQSKAHPVTNKPAGVCTTRGCPADVASGQFFDVRTDLYLPGTIPVVFQRVCQRNAAGLLGKGWTSNWTQHLQIDSGVIYFHDPEGVIISFHAPYEQIDAENVRFPHLRLFSDDRKSFTVWNSKQQLYYIFAEANFGRVWLSRIEDRNGNTVSFIYDPDGLARVVHSDGFDLSVHSENWLLKAVFTGVAEDTRRMVEWSYTARGCLEEVHSAQSGYLHYYYDEHDRIVRWHDSKASDVSYIWNQHDRVARIVSTSGYMSGDFSYDIQNRITRFTDGLGATSVYFHDEDGLVWKEIDPLGHEWLTEWGISFNIVSTTTPLGIKSTLEYDEIGNAVSATDADGATSSWVYRPDGLLASSSDAEGNSREYHYDNRGNMVAMINEVGETTSLRVGKRGEMLRVDQPNGGQSRVFYDHLMRPRAVTDAAGNTRTMQYDIEGRLLWVTDALGHQTRFDYRRDAINPKGAVREVLLADGSREQFEYDSEGKPARFIDGNGNVRDFSYGAFDLPLSTTDSFGNRLRYEYDSEGRMIAVINAKSERYEFVYDAAGRMLREREFGGITTSYSHDADGRTISRLTADGVETLYDYNVRNELLAASVLRDGVKAGTRYAYDKRGLLIAAESADSRIKFEYDALGRATREELNGRAVLSGYTKGELNRVTREGDSAALQLSYDPAGEVQSLSIAGHGAMAFSRDARGFEVLRRSETGFAQAQSYSPTGLLEAQIAGPLAAVSSQVSGLPGHEKVHSRHTVMGALKVNRHYQWDPAANLVGITDGRWGETRYAHDSRNQIVQTTHQSRFAGASFMEHFGYDACNNLSLADYASGTDRARATKETFPGQSVEQAAGGRVRKRGHFHYAYDPRGRVIEKRYQEDGFRPRIWRYEWDGQNRLVQLETPEGETWRYGYDALGRRIRRLRVIEGSKKPSAGRPAPNGLGKSQGAAVGAAYQWDCNQLIAEAPVYADGTIAWDKARSWIYEPGTFKPLAQLGANGDLHYVVTDQAGTPRELISEDGGKVAWAAGFRTWGQVEKQQFWPDDPAANDNEAVETIDCPLRFQGQWEDSESGLYYNHQRYYDPDSAQYLTPDPIGLSGGSRLQGYVANPGTWVDPMGLVPCVPQSGSYRDLRKTLKGTNQQANHLNQDAAFRDVIPHSQGAANAMQGNAFKDIGTPHYEFHKSLEGFWDKYRKGGSEAGKTPTIGQYDTALRDALKSSGYSSSDVNHLASVAEQNRTAYGLGNSDPVPRIPGRINQRK